MHKPIILIGGTSGTGKTTLAHNLTVALSLDQRLSTGFIRSVLQAERGPEKEPLLFTHTFNDENPPHHMEWQAKRMRPGILRCIERARKEGTSIVIEGPALLPSLYHDADAAFFLVLEPPTTDEHHNRLFGKTRHKRQMTDKDIENAGIINNFVIEEAKNRDIPVFTYHDNLDEIVEAIKQKFHKQ